MGRYGCMLLASALAVGSAAAYSFPDCTAPPLSDNAVCDTSLDSVARATALIDLFTVPELINNTVNASPGVPRLGLPAYQWWSEALVSYRYLAIPITHLSNAAWCCAQSWSKLLCVWRVQLCYFLPSADSHECCF